METFETRLAQAIENSGLTRPEFAARSGVGTSALAKWLGGKLMPKSEQLLALARTGGVSMEWLLTGAENARGNRHEPLVLREEERPYGSAKSASNLKAAAKSAEVLAAKLRDAENELERLRSFLG